MSNKLKLFIYSNRSFLLFMITKLIFKQFMQGNRFILQRINNHSIFSLG